MLILLIALPLLTGLAAALPFPSRRGRLTFLLTMQIIETALVVWTLVSGRSYTTNIWHLTESLTIAMKLDGVAAVFSALTAVAWLLALIYSVEYMSHSQNEARFYVFLFLRGCCWERPCRQTSYLCTSFTSSPVSAPCRWCSMS